jgi:RNA polymerase sigma-70 factor (ECF subfamily)
MKQWMESLYREHRQGLFTYALSILGCPQTAEDAIQNAFTRLHRSSNAAVEMEQQNMVPYVFRCVRNCAIDLQRKHHHQRRLSESLFESFQQTDNTPSPPDSLLTEERAEMLRAAIDELAESEREVVVLKMFAGLTFEQAGEMAETSPKTMATRYRRALIKLENQLKGQI